LGKKNTTVLLIALRRISHSKEPCRICGNGLKIILQLYYGVIANIDFIDDINDRTLVKDTFK